MTRQKTTLYGSDTWISDVDEVLSVLPDIHTLAGKSVLITGAAGLICSSVVDILFRYNDTHDVPVHIYAAGRRPEKMKDRFGSMVEREDFTFIPYDSSRSDNTLDVPADYIIHGAGNAIPELVIKEPVETMLSNFTGMKCLLDHAKKSGTKRVLYISSSEVYGEKAGNRPYRENDYGFIDLMNVRNSYSVGKRAAETLCASYAAEYGVESVIVRPGHIYGPTASPLDNRVSSVWANTATRGEDIVMKSDGAKIRSYCYCLDCASAICKVLIMGENSHAYNISNPDSVISIRNLGEILARTAGVQLRSESMTEKEKETYCSMENSSLDSSELIRLGWKGLFDAERGLTHTVKILREIRGDSDTRNRS